MASLLPAHPYNEGFAFGSQVNVRGSCLLSQDSWYFDFTLYRVQKNRVMSFQVRSRFGLPLYGQAVSLVLTLQFLVKYFRMIFKKNVSIIFSFSMGVCPNDQLPLLEMEIVPPSILHTDQTYLI